MLELPLCKDVHTVKITNGVLVAQNHQLISFILVTAVKM